MTAQGRQNALSMIAASDRGTMLDASTVFYMDKIVSDDRGHGVISLEQSIGDNIRELAKKKGKPVGEMVVAILDRPRHAGLIEDIRAAGAGTRILLDGDVAGGINAARHGTRIDLCVGIGGSPEGVVTACAIKALGGFIEGRLAPKDDAERQRGIDAGLDMDRIYDAEGLVAGDNTMFIATGVTDGGLLEGVRLLGSTIRTESVVLRSRSGTFRRIVSEHVADRWL
jgi:fructose-1,6-bisphosphatase II